MRLVHFEFECTNFQAISITMIFEYDEPMRSFFFKMVIVHNDEKDDQAEEWKKTKCQE